ncbi:hypothetical protein VNO77_20539 [Canavalia gladiata]|uniref:Uncharacterized protein n=1 Tax=Canavalia gladiata TaxID=3824 RepID=A0AAN9LTC6_CANGL
MLVLGPNCSVSDFYQLWAEQLLNIGDISATTEFKFESAYGYLSEEKGVHYLIWGSQDESAQLEILLFNCLYVRDPHILLPRLVNTCGSSVISSDLHGMDLLWQFNLQRIWEKIMHGKGMPSSICHSRDLTLLSLCLSRLYCLSCSKWIFRYQGAITQSNIIALNFGCLLSRYSLEDFQRLNFFPHLFV